LATVLDVWVKQSKNICHTSGIYRYGFNAKKSDNNVKGMSDQIDYEARIYGPRMGRFLSDDPLEWIGYELWIK
jgi:RHS repeat-associated protein